MIEPGEIYYADLDVAGRRPVIVVSREDLNRGHYVLVVVCTSSRFTLRQTLPQCVPFRAGQFGFSADCVAQCENMLSVHLSNLDWQQGPLGKLDDPSHRSLIRAIGHVIEADCEPN